VSILARKQEKKLSGAACWSGAGASDRNRRHAGEILVDFRIQLSKTWKFDNTQLELSELIEKPNSKRQMCSVSNAPKSPHVSTISAEIVKRADV
jgi:hypothetical protein